MHFIGTTNELGSRSITKTAAILRGVHPEREMITILRSAQEDSQGLRMAAWRILSRFRNVRAHRSERDGLVPMVPNRDAPPAP